DPDLPGRPGDAHALVERQQEQLDRVPVVHADLRPDTSEMSNFLSAVPVVSWELCVLITLIGCLIFDRSVLKHLDYSLLITFACFFIFVGNIKHVQVIASTLQSIVVGREILVSALASQVISNVPAAIMLSGFSSDGIGLLVGTNIGGLGTPVASLASLITLRVYGRSRDAQTGRYLLWFTAINLALLVLFLGLASLLSL
ncbi:MAG: hypothetical protein U0N89_04480, partial [Collinsella intestinalis]